MEKNVQNTGRLVNKEVTYEILNFCECHANATKSMGCRDINSIKNPGNRLNNQFDYDLKVDYALKSEKKKAPEVNQRLNYNNPLR